MRPLWIIVSLLLVASPAVTSAAAAEYRAKDPAKPLVARKRTGRPALTEAEALRLAQGDTAFGQVQDARVDVARSDVIEAGLPPNPALELSYESADGAGDPSDTKLRLSQTLDTSGRRGLRQKGAKAQLEAARWMTDSERIERAMRVRSEFYRVLHEQERLAVLASWDARVGAAAKIVRDRTGAGEASGYDLRRLEHERSLARAERDEVAGGLAQAWESLLALLGVEDRRYTAVDGRLLPPSPPALDTLTSRLDQRPDLLALRQREEAARLARQAGSRGTIPDVTLGLGAKRVSELDRDDWGLVLDVSVPLTLFDRGQAATSRADAESRALAGEHQLAVREAHGSLRGLWQKASELQRAASRLQASDVPQARTLAQTAQSAYQGGEIGILELLDAQRGVKEAETRALDLALASRLTMIELDRLSGGNSQ
jgi:cobalt-zinc-cadmium efflux system outer membrane protein